MVYLRQEANLEMVQADQKPIISQKIHNNCMLSSIVQITKIKHTHKSAKKLMAMDKCIQIFMQENLDTSPSQKGQDKSSCFLFGRIFTNTLYPLHLEAFLLQNGKFGDINFQSPLTACRCFEHRPRFYQFPRELEYNSQN